MKYRDIITLTKSTVTKDAIGHASFGAPVDVMDVYASVKLMSASKTLLTFQLADVVGLDIEMWKPSVEYNGIRWKGHDVHFSVPQDTDIAGRTIRISGYYQIDDPVQNG